VRSRTRNTLAAGIVIAGLAFAPLTNAQLFDGQRSHGDSKDQMIGSELIAAGLTERAGPAECEDANDDGVEDSVTVGDVTFECTNIDLLSFVPKSEIFGDLHTDLVLSGGGISDIWGWTSPDTGDEYVIAGATNGAAVLRITDPENPEYLGHVLNTGAQLIWFDIKVNNDHAYIVSESPAMGMKILDLTLLDLLPEVPAGTTVPLPVTTYPLDLTAHNVVINEDTDMLYLVGSGQALGLGSICATDSGAAPTDNAGLHAVDISQPKVPVYVGCHTDEGYVHDAHCATYTGPDERHQDKPICVTAHEDGVAWVDMSDPTDPVTLFDTKTAENSEELYPRVAYSHQGWMSEDQTLYYHGDELDEKGTELTRTFVYDMTDLEDVKLDFINEPGGTNIDHNMYTHRGLLFQSNYTAGLQVFDQVPVVDEVTGEKSLEMVAEFDVFPDCTGIPVPFDDVRCDGAVFAGTWSNYPYFESGTLAVTATEDGLFFLKLDPELEAAYPVDGEVATTSLPEQAAEQAHQRARRGA
jgi:choice-of-anchor B domain-containing protein